MQGQRSIFDPFPEAVDLNQGSSSNTASMDESDDWNTILSPMERRLLNNDLSSELNFTCVNTNSQSFSSWDVGESSTTHEQQLDTHQASNMQTSVSNHINLNMGYGGSNSDDDDDDMGSSDSSLGNWGLSCKRKALEGTTSGSNCIPQTEDLGRRNVSVHPFRSLNISSSLVNNRHEQSTTRIGPFPSSVPYNRHPIPNATSSSNRQILINEFLDQTSRGGPNLSNPLNPPPPLMHVPSIPRNTNHFPWSSTMRSSSSSRSFLRNNMQYHNFVPSSEPLNLVQDPTTWSLATGGGASGGAASSSGGSRWTHHHHLNNINNNSNNNNNTTTQSQQRLSDFPPWTLFPSPEVETGSQRGHFRHFPPGSSSTSEDTHTRVPSNRHQPFSRSPLLMEMPGDDWRALAADIEGRQRLVSEIRQVLHAMRRGENLRAEDYMLFDPFINGVAELHDRHRDMRLDVDNMSYEELLALEERIGNVNTGLSEEFILKSMKQRKHIAFMAISTQNLEPCCICQEEYDTGDDIGSLDCGHDFHTVCIKQWLAQKNLCPICKMTGLGP